MRFLIKSALLLSVAFIISCDKKSNNNNQVAATPNGYQCNYNNNNGVYTGYNNNCTYVNGLINDPRSGVYPYSGTNYAWTNINTNICPFGQMPAYIGFALTCVNSGWSASYLYTYSNSLYGYGKCNVHYDQHICNCQPVQVWGYQTAEGYCVY